MGVTIEGDAAKSGKNTDFGSDNACEAIAENWSTQLDESGSIQKRKRLETPYEEWAQLLRNSFNVTYAVLLLCAHKC